MCSNLAGYFFLAINNINFYNLAESSLVLVTFIILFIILVVNVPLPSFPFYQCVYQAISYDF
jgi:hypothetical protein